MNTARQHVPTTAPSGSTGLLERTPSADGVEQLVLLAPTAAPVQFRLDERTRRRGLAQIALIRQQLASLAADRPTDTTAASPTSTDTPATGHRTAA